MTSSFGQTGGFAVIGGAGYVGSRLVDYLSLDRGLSVVAYDRDPRNSSRPVVNIAAKDIPTSELQSYDTVVYLGGLTGRVLCDLHPNDTFVENVEDLANVALRMKSSQLLLFASTSSLITGWGTAQKAEDSPLYINEFDRYEASIATREINMRILSDENPATFPRAIGMRFGSVMGVSPSQRTDLVYMGLMCSAFTNGRMTVTHPETSRSILWLEDLVRVVEKLHEKSSLLKRFDIFHVQSHWGSVSKIANAVASANHAHIHIKEHAPKPDGAGFSINASKLESAIDFEFEGSPDVVVAHLLEHVPTMCVGRELLSRTGKESPPCVVCGSTDMMPVLDLHKQPLANDFFDSIEKALACDTFPLAIARCRVCQHTQLTHLVDRERLFRDYKYLSGTTTTLKDYFAWLAAKIVAEVQADRPVGSKPNSEGVVLEVACNDGTQLDEFKKLGWNTYCVDPAENIAALSRARGHNVQVGFWGEEEFNLPPPETLDAIVGQNVLAHVLDPLAFLKACAKSMGTRTRLYLQTSQCEMYESGQFDTVYHEHVSFFSAHSFAKLAELADLTITDFSKTPIHGVSCLVTFMRSSSGNPTKEHSLTLKDAMAHEVSIGLTSDFFYLRYRGQARAMQMWMNAQLSDLYQHGFEVVGFGAAAKGMVLLHYLRSVPGRTWELSFVVDESPLKQGTFCPGTTIPVVPLSAFVSRDTKKPLVVIVFPWNFAEEILKKLAQKMQSTSVRSVLAIIPFPRQRLIKIAVSNGVMETMLLNPTKLLDWPVSAPGSKKSPFIFAFLFFKNVSRREENVFTLTTNYFPVFFHPPSFTPLLSPLLILLSPLDRMPLLLHTGFATILLFLTPF